jgi:hypothetical protein
MSLYKLLEMDSTTNRRHYFRPVTSLATEVSPQRHTYDRYLIDMRCQLKTNRKPLVDAFFSIENTCARLVGRLDYYRVMQTCNV